MLKGVLIGFMTIFLAACNLTTIQESSPAPATDTDSPTLDEIQSEINLTPIFTATMESPTLTIEFQELPTSSFNTINIASATPLPIGVRPPTQPTNLPIQITPLTADNPNATDIIPFPQTFNDQYEINAGQGRTIYVTYEVVVNNPETGRVFIEVRDPVGETIGQLVLSETATDEFEVSTSTGGAHQLLVTSQNLRGFYSVGYGTR